MSFSVLKKSTCIGRMSTRPPKTQTTPIRVSYQLFKSLTPSYGSGIPSFHPSSSSRQTARAPVPQTSVHTSYYSMSPTTSAYVHSTVPSSRSSPYPKPPTMVTTSTASGCPPRSRLKTRARYQLSSRSASRRRRQRRTDGPVSWDLRSTVLVLSSFHTYGALTPSSLKLPGEIYETISPLWPSLARIGDMSRVW